MVEKAAASGDSNSHRYLEWIKLAESYPSVDLNVLRFAAAKILKHCKENELSGYIWDADFPNEPGVQIRFARKDYECEGKYYAGGLPAYDLVGVSPIFLIDNHNQDKPKLSLRIHIKPSCD